MLLYFERHGGALSWQDTGSEKPSGKVLQHTYRQPDDLCCGLCCCRIHPAMTVRWGGCVVLSV